MKKLFRKMLLQHAFPQYLIVSGLGSVWAIYFVWQHQIILALVSTIVFSHIVPTLLVLKKNEEAYADTFLGRFALSHLGLWSGVFHILGYSVLVYGFWLHSGFYILVAGSLILLGHLRDKTLRTK